MRRHVRLVTMVLVGAFGMASAMALSAGADDIRACVSKSGSVTPVGRTGKCAATQSVITISGDAFKAGKRGAITINGVPFKKSSRGKVITINGTAFRSGTLPNMITINGNSFRSGTLPNSLTINGNSFRSSGKVLTINGTEFGPGAAVSQGPAGPAGPEGKPGAAGPPGTVAAGKAPLDVPGPVKVTSGTSGKLGGLEFSASGPRRIMLTGGFNAVCNPCFDRFTPGWSLSLEGGSNQVQRRMSVIGDGEHAGATVSEIIVTPDVCGPCTYNLNLVVPPAGVSGAASNVDASAIRLGLVDLGPVAP